MSSTSLECRDVTKAFGGAPVLRGVSLTLMPGTVTALAGENGAGKSTLMKIISGQVRPDGGNIALGGTTLPYADVRASQRLGVAIVPQELAPIVDMTVYENLFVGREVRSSVGLLDRRAMIRRAREMLDVFGVSIDPTAPVRTLSVALQQIVEIVKTTSRGAHVILLDEPTSAIADREVDRLYDIVRTLREQGVAMLYTTHKMAEIRALADRVVVLRDGELVVDTSVDEIDDDGIVTAMIGRELTGLFPRVRTSSSETVLEVRDLHVQGAAAPVSLSVRRGEILGLSGLVGAGRSELIEAIFGARRSTAGTITIAGRPVKRNAPASSIGAGMALVPEDRKGAGLVLSMTVSDNGALPRLSQFSTAGWVRRRDQSRAVDEAIHSVRLRSRGGRQEVSTLSGGNQQKLVLARWLTGHVDVLLLDEPTRGVDVGARSEIYAIICELAASGMAVVMASSDMAEILGLSHRVLAMREGAFVGELERDQLQAPDVQDRLFRLAAGLDEIDPAEPGREPVDAPPLTPTAPTGSRRYP